ncbi:MAG: hypothetical protein IT382_03475 [Deltaproteobacteria bacterium]|nr:hypothetical protein [Deltaproteobacteria bacterium]
MLKKQALHSLVQAASLVVVSLLSSSSVSAQAAGDLVATKVAADLSAADPAAAYWQSAPAMTVTLMGQPMVLPKPEKTTTDKVTVQAVNDGKRAAFRVRWKDSEKSEAGRLGEFSDAFALQFPVKPGETPPPVMMGAKDNPVHLFHWRAQYQRDKEKGKPDMKALYPNGAVDMYPMEFKEVALGTDAQREKFSPGRIEGNPQSYEKTGVDEVVAEGFSTSQVTEGHGSVGQAVWKDGEWTLVISRPLMIDGGSQLAAGKKNFVAFAAWQGGQGEVGSRKSVTMTWTNLVVKN